MLVTVGYRATATPFSTRSKFGRKRSIRNCFEGPFTLFVGQVHKNWVTKTMYVPELMVLVTSSLDCTLQLRDFELDKPKWTLKAHKQHAHIKGIHGFDWSKR